MNEYNVMSVMMRLQEGNGHNAVIMGVTWLIILALHLSGLSTLYRYVLYPHKLLTHQHFVHLHMHHGASH